MIGYASRTGTKTTKAAMQAAGWRMLVSPKGMTNPLLANDLPHALDSGAWWSHKNDQPFDGDAYMRALHRFGHSADWVALPDIVAGGKASLDLSLSWRLRVRSILPISRLLLVVQDGMEVSDVEPLLWPLFGIFVGGSTEWKLATMRQWCDLAHTRGAWAHVGRVNTARRIHLCQAAGADSFDGTSVTQFPKTLAMLELSRQQLDIERHLRVTP